MTLQVVSFTLPAGQSVSDPADCAGANAVRLIMPPEWSGGAPITFQLSPDGVNFHNLYHVIPDAMLTFEVTLPQPRPGSAMTFPTGMGQGLDWVKVRSGTAGMPVVQEEDRVFQLILQVTGTAARESRDAAGATAAVAASQESATRKSHRRGS
jgi:hypothetical protein